jgi:hypothetical protein
MTTATLMTDATLTDDNVYCEDCSQALTDAEIDECGYLCTKCHAKHTFTCSDCGDLFDNDEASPRCKTRCETCQETKDEIELEERKDALKEEARDLLDTLCDDGDLAALRPVSLRRHSRYAASPPTANGC